MALNRRLGLFRRAQVHAARGAADAAATDAQLHRLSLLQRGAVRRLRCPHSPC